jgi:hypothetical protein
VDAAAQRDAAKNEIAALGAPVIPYVVAGCYDGNVDARTACMSLLGQLSARNAVKQAIEVFFAAMPESGEPASYQVPFLRAVRTTLPILTGQSFINVEPSSSLVQNGLRDYIKWYEDNYDRLPPQLGEKKLDATDPEYLEKLQEARKLKLEKKSWPRPPMSADMVGGDREGGRPQPRASDVERPADQSILRTIPKLSRDDAFRRR